MAPCSTISLQPGKPSLESPLSKTDPYFGTRGGLALIQREVRVGIVGADARASWAKVSHVPAIKGLPGLKLVAVATRNERSARKRLKPSVLIAGFRIPSRCSAMTGLMS